MATSPSVEDGAPYFPLPSYASNVKQLLSDRKLTLPTEIVRSVGWLEGTRPTIDLIADLDEPGRFTLYQMETVLHLIKALAKEIRSEEVTPEVPARLQVLQDRYHIARIDRPGFRLRLTEHILVHMGVDPSASPDPQPWFLIQGRSDCVDVMTIEYRNTRLRRWRSQTSIDR